MSWCQCISVFSSDYGFRSGIHVRIVVVISKVFVEDNYVSNVKVVSVCGQMRCQVNVIRAYMLFPI